MIERIKLWFIWVWLKTENIYLTNLEKIDHRIWDWVLFHPSRSRWRVYYVWAGLTHPYGFAHKHVLDKFVDHQWHSLKEIEPELAWWIRTGSVVRYLTRVHLLSVIRFDGVDYYRSSPVMNDILELKGNINHEPDK